MYTPSYLAINKNLNYNGFDDGYKEELYREFSSLYKRIIAQGHNVIIGQMGIINKNNTDDGIAWAEYFVETSRKFHMPSIIWDNNKYDNSKSAEDTFGQFHRGKLTRENEELIDTFIKFSSTQFSTIFRN